MSLSSTPALTKCGSLHKRAEHVHNMWNRRWFVLRGDGTLAYYSKHEDLAPKQVFMLKGCAVSPVTTKKPHSFEVIFSEKKRLVLAAEKLRTMQEWVEDIRAASTVSASPAPGENQPSPVSDLRTLEFPLPPEPDRSEDQMRKEIAQRKSVALTDLLKGLGDGGPVKPSVPGISGEISEEKGPDVVEQMEGIMGKLRSGVPRLICEGSRAIANACLKSTSHGGERLLDMVEEQGMEILMALLSHTSEQVQYYAVSAVAQISVHLKDKGELARGDTLKPLVTMLSADDAKLQCNAAFAIAFLTENESVAGRVVALNGVAPLINLLEIEDLDTRANASLALANLVINDENKEHVVFLGGLDQLVHLLPSSHVRVQRNCAKALATLAIYEEYQSQIVAKGGIPPLVDLLRSSNEEVCTTATAIISLLSENGQYKDGIVKAGGIGPLLSILMEQDGMVQAIALEALSNLSSEEECLDALAEAAGLDALVRLLTSEDGDIVCDVAKIIANLCQRSDLQIAVVGRGALEHLFSLLTLYDENILYQATRALASLALNNSNKLAMVRTCNFNTIVGLLGGSVPEVQDVAVGTIAYLSMKDECHEFLLRDGVVSQLVSCLASESLVVVRNSSGALSNLADNECNKDALIQADCAPALITLLKNVEEADILTNVTSTLTSLNLDGSIAQQLCEQDAIRILVNLLSHASAFVRHFSAVILNNSCDYQPTVSAIVTADGIEKLVAAVTSQDTAIHSDVTGVLAILALVEANRTPIVSAGAVPGLLTLEESDDEDTAYNAKLVLQHLALSGEIGETIELARKRREKEREEEDVSEW